MSRFGHMRGLGANIDVMTLSGYHGAGVGIWKEVYSDTGFPKAKKSKTKKCKHGWKTEGKGCNCTPVCAKPGEKSTSKKKAEKACERKCSSTQRAKRRRT
jgi:hypothetical protein